MHETETKILDVDKEKIALLMGKMNATKIQDTLLKVRWFRTKGTKEGEEQWFLRIRTNSDGKTELTWKGISQKLGASRTHKEIVLFISDPQMASVFLEEIGMEEYAYQEKNRTSWTYKQWKFDLDHYPDMPPYLEIEGNDEEHIQEAIKLLELENKEASNEGERILIQKNYGLDRNNMRF